MPGADTYLLLYTYVEDMVDRRGPHREAHLAASVPSARRVASSWPVRWATRPPVGRSRGRGVTPRGHRAASRGRPVRRERAGHRPAHRALEPRLFRGRGAPRRITLSATRCARHSSMDDSGTGESAHLTRSECPRPALRRSPERARMSARAVALAVAKLVPVASGEKQPRQPPHRVRQSANRCISGGSSSAGSVVREEIPPQVTPRNLGQGCGFRAHGQPAEPPRRCRAG